MTVRPVVAGERADGSANAPRALEADTVFASVEDASRRSAVGFGHP
jgi:hypothetical protein